MKNYLKISLITAVPLLILLSIAACDNNIVNKKVTYSVTADHTGNGKTENLIFIFSESVDEKVYTDDIKLTPVAPAAATITGELDQQNGRYYKLKIFVAEEGNVKIKITSPDIESGEKTVRVNKSAVE